MELNASVARCSFGTTVVPVAALLEGRLTCVTPAQDMSHVEFRLALNGRELLLAASQLCKWAPNEMGIKC